MPEAVTRNIRVRVETEYAPGRSNPAQNKWFFLYTIRMTNEGRETVKLVSRHWIITDAMGDVKKCADRASSASSRCSNPAKASSTRLAAS